MQSCELRTLLIVWELLQPQPQRVKLVWLNTLHPNVVLPFLQYYTKLEAESAADALSHTPEAATSALGTAVEMVSGAAGHIVDKVGQC